VSGLQVDSDAAAFARRMFDGADALADLDATNAEAGDLVLSSADVPRRSGSLAAGVRYAATPDGVTFAASVPYWTFVHWGAPGRGIRARPFFSNALELRQSDIADLYREHAARVVSSL
jgi:hypothetical protein